MEAINTRVSDCRIVPLKTVQRPEGSLVVIQNELFTIRRVYYIFGVPVGAERGYHAHKTLQQLIIPIAGCFTVQLKDGWGHVNTLRLNKPDEALHVVPGIWRQLMEFTAGAVCLVMASAEYDEADYIRNYQAFIHFKTQK